MEIHKINVPPCDHFYEWVSQEEERCLYCRASRVSHMVKCEECDQPKEIYYGGMCRGCARAHYD